MKRKKYWAGFCNGELDYNFIERGQIIIPAVFLIRKDAQESYEDVRPVEIREIKKRKKD